ncbi:MAG: DMT family transporter [Anaerolineaceae bacterium]|nr:DMT family transporter [Anaerolineaceae bacterium]
MQNSLIESQNQVKSQDMAIVAVLMVVDSLHFVFAKLLHPYIQPEISVFFVILIGFLEVGLFGVITGRLRLVIFRRNLFFFFAVGFLVAVSTYLTYEAVGYIDPGTASLLSQASVVFGLGFGFFWFKERFSWNQKLGALVAILGVAVITFQPGDYFRMGSLIVLVAAGVYAGHMALVKRYGGEIDILNFFFFRLLTTTLFLLIMLLSQESVPNPGGRAWLLLILTGTIDVAFSRSLYYFVLKRVNISLFSILLTLSPAITLLWSFILFGVQPGPRQIIGGGAVLAGVILTTRKKKST